jgi:glucose/arabinose dehydrogenase
MVRRVAALLAAVALGAGCAGSTAATGLPATAKLRSIGAGLRGPAGLTASVDATGLEHVAALATDSEGRVWAATAAYSDQGDDGVYVVTAPGATPLEVISSLHTPLGLLWYGNELYVSSNERVDAYRDFDGTTFATHRTVVTFPDGVGENNGIARAPDGRIMIGISAPCDACTPSLKWSATVASFEPDGTDLRVEADGIRAPVGLAYFPGTSRLFVTMNQRDKLGKKTPGDWLAVVRNGQSWGFPDCYGQDAEACTAVPEPTAVLDKHAAASGVAIVTGGLGPAVGTAAVVAEWARATVMRVPLTSGGSTPAGSAEPFLTGFKSPEPVLTLGDGALLVGDWARGTIYRISRAA